VNFFMTLHCQQIKASFNKAAATYDQAAHLQHEIGENLCRRLDWIPCQSERIVDVGCGTGHLSVALARHYPHAQVVALDLAENMLRRASAQTLRVCADARRLPLASASVDILISNLMLQWSTDIPAMFAEFARVLRPDGVLLFSTFGPATLNELRASWAAVDASVHVNDFADMHPLGDALLAAGLANPVMDADRLRRYYPDAYSLMRELKALGAHNLNADRARGLTGKQHWLRMLNAYEKQREEAGLPATYEVIYGFARGAKQRDSGFCVPLSALKTNRAARA
jgi:malonyl-CoA O-methyltransferase